MSAAASPSDGQTVTITLSDGSLWEYDSAHGEWLGHVAGGSEELASSCPMRLDDGALTAEDHRKIADVLAPSVSVEREALALFMEDLTAILQDENDHGTTGDCGCV